VARALKATRGSAVSLATPGLFGVRAAGLRLAVPARTPDLDPDRTPAAYLPPEPARFVGRAAAMALAPASGWVGVLLHGMAGAGKTACAVELAYRHHACPQAPAAQPRLAEEPFLASYTPSHGQCGTASPSGRADGGR
jgi:hypothetical protein